MGGLNFIGKIKTKWQTIICLEAVIYALSLAGFSMLTFRFDLLPTVGIFIVVLAIALVSLRPWKIDMMQSARLVDRELEVVESSAVLLVEMGADSSLLYRLQQQKVSKLLQNFAGTVKVPHHLNQSLIFALVVTGLGFLIQTGQSNNSDAPNNANTSEVVFTPEDSTEAAFEEVKLQALNLTITPPAYTGVRATKSEQPNLNVIEGTIVKWRVEMSTPIESLSLKSGGMLKAFEKVSGTVFEGVWQVQNAGFYNFEFLRGEEKMVSDIYQIEVQRDETPQIEVMGLEAYTRFHYDDLKRVRFTSAISDDFGLTDAHIIATVAKGSGESVKFREERLEFDEPLRQGRNSANLSKSIDLDQMGLTPGDELYFYVQAIDNKAPEVNISRTATYFISIIDTTDIEFSLAGSLGVDLMPDYFRSQRQIIIETEQLIKDKPSLIKQDFNSKSNELGFDQKALRIRYGQFMGEEFESGMMQVDAEGNVLDEGDDHEEDDPLAAYSHDHDNENEHNLVEDEEEDPLEQYKHSHDDPEEATFFSVSIKEKLRQAMTEMWDAELYLRLYEPEKSLPYQYKALELLKQIKNHARVYVHRIGFDPAPIKEDVRLTGELDGLNSLTRAEQVGQNDRMKNIRRSIARMAALIESKEAPSERDKAIFEQAGNELAGLAIESPGSYLNTLQQLKQLSFDNLPNEALSPVLASAYQGLIKALPQQLSQPAVSDAHMTQLKKALLSEIDKISNDR